MAFEQIAAGKRINYHGVDKASGWDAVHNYIEWKTGDGNISAYFENVDIYDLLSENEGLPKLYNVVILQYLIAGHIYSNRAERIEELYNGIIDNLVSNKRPDSPMLIIVNDIDHKSWICDYFNLFIQKLRKAGFAVSSAKRHFEKRDDGENNGSVLHKSSANKFLKLISSEQRDKYNAHAPCSAAQLIIEVT
jgi:hypothetical protein